MNQTAIWRGWEAYLDKYNPPIEQRRELQKAYVHAWCVASGIEAKRIKAVEWIEERAEMSRAYASGRN